MAPWCIHISCLERVARSGSGRDSVRGLSSAYILATAPVYDPTELSRVCTPSLRQTKKKQISDALIRQDYKDKQCKLTMIVYVSTMALWTQYGRQLGLPARPGCLVHRQ